MLSVPSNYRAGLFMTAQAYWRLENTWSMERQNMDMRELKALEIAARTKIAFVDGAWLVPSQTTASKSYRVTLGNAVTCECDDFQLRREPCKPMIAARLVCARDHGDQAPR